jgi:outer membrane protein assembly factor BamE (lipoprotein component of BamABCDE complex)
MQFRGSFEEIPMKSAYHRKAFLVAGLVLIASGCSSIRDHRGYLVDTTLTDAIQPGIDNRTSVERTLGRPTFTGQFSDDIWYYVSQDTRQRAFQRPRTSQQLVMRVSFDAAGKVIAVDRAGAEKVVALNPNKNKTPTLGRDRGLLEDLFGNIGTVGAPGVGGGGGGGGGGPNGS